MIGSSHRRFAKSPLGIVLIINLLGKELTLRASMGDGGSIWWAPGIFQDTLSPTAIELFQKIFSHLFLSRHVLSKLCIGFAITWNLNLAVNLVTSFSRQKLLKSKNKNYRIFLEYKLLPSCKALAETNTKRESSSKDALLGVLYAHRADCSTCASSGMLPVSLND